MPLTFTADAIEDGDRMTINFAGYDGDKRVLCRVSREALDDLLAPNRSDDRMSIYRIYQGGIQSNASTKYDRGLFEADGSVMIRSADVV